MEWSAAIVLTDFPVGNIFTYYLTAIGFYPGGSGTIRIQTNMDHSENWSSVAGEWTTGILVTDFRLIDVCGHFVSKYSMLQLDRSIMH
jgi:hypothetical protein